MRKTANADLRGGRTGRATTLEDAQDSLDQEADTLAQATAQLTDAARCDPTGAVYERCQRRLRTWPALTPSSRLRSRDSSTCQQLREETHILMSTMDWVLVAVEGLVVIGFIALGVRSGGIGLGLWGGVGTLVLVFVFGLDPGEPPISAILIIIAVVSAAAAMQAVGRRRLHGPGREQGAAGQAEGTQLRRAVRLVSPHDPHRHEQHVLLDHPGDQRGRVREQDPARARARRLDGRQCARHHVEPCRGSDGHPSAAGRDLRLRPRRRPAHHDSGEPGSGSSRCRSS